MNYLSRTVIHHIMPFLPFFSWDLRRDRASNYIRSIEIGANVKMNLCRGSGMVIYWIVDHMKCELIDDSYGIFQSLHCVWISSIDWCMVSVLGARSREQSPQPTLTSVCL